MLGNMLVEDLAAHRDAMQDALDHLLHSWQSEQNDIIQRFFQKLHATEGMGSLASASQRDVPRRHPHAPESEEPVTDHKTLSTPRVLSSVLTSPRGSKSVTNRSLHESKPPQGTLKTMRFTEETPPSKSVGAAHVVGRERDLSPRSSDTVHAETSEFVKAYFLEDRFNNSLLVRRVSKEIQHFKRGERMRRLSSSVASWKRRMPDVPLPNTFVARLVSSFWFECLCALLIVLNTAALTVIVDLQARNRTSTTSNTTLHWLELSFSAWFLLELVLRIVGLRVLFLLGADGLVNCLDLFFVPCFVVLALLAVVIDGEDQSSSGVSYIRVYRFVSFLKVIRFARPLRLLPWARLLAGTLQFCCRFFLPTILLALCLPYVGSLIILSALSYNDSTSDLQEHWGSVFTAMVSLLATSCGGADWDVIGEPLKESWALPYLMMLLHAIVFRLVIVNVVACGYLQSTMDQLHLSARHNMHLQLENADTYVARFRDIFRQDHLVW